MIVNFSIFYYYFSNYNYELEFKFIFSHNVRQARLEELLFHEGNLRMSGIQIFKYFLAFILEVAIGNGTKSQTIG